MSVPANSDSPQVKLIHEWSSGFEKRDLAHIAKYLHKDYRHAHYPRSLGRPEQTREQWLEHFERVLSLWTESKTVIHSIIETPGRVIVHMTINVDTSLGVGVVHESILIVHITTDEGGSLKIEQIEDFIDSKAFLDFVQAVTEAKTKG